MSPLVKTKRQDNFKDFKRFGALKGFVEQKKPCIQLVRVSIGLFDTRGPLKHSFHSRLNSPLVPKKPQFTQELVK
jgi:hypothetical protein